MPFIGYGMELVNTLCTMKNLVINKRGLFFLFISTLIPISGSGGEVSYLYSLSDFLGTLPYDHVKVSIDEVKNEIYVITGDSIKVFNQSGMEIYTINTVDLEIGSAVDLAVDRDGNILILSYDGMKYNLWLCNYRGEPLSRIELKGLPPGFEDFSPDGLILRDDLLYLSSSGSMSLVVSDLRGNVKETLDLATIAGVSVDDRGMGQLSIDKDGNILFTAPVIARAFILSPERKLMGFGRRGSAPGRFGIPTGIARDSEGNIYVSDKLRSCILIFDKEMKFIREFGYRGFRPENLIVPGFLAMDSKGRLYVTQMRKRGISVFKVTNALN